MNDNFEYKLQTPFQYSVDGDMVYSKSLTVYSPKNKVKQWVAVIDDAISFCKAELAFKDKPGKDDKNTSEASKEMSDEDKAQFASLMVMLIGSHGKTEMCINALEQILKSGGNSQPSCQIDGVVEMNSLLFNEMGFSDGKKLLGEYIKNFILSSQVI